MALQNEITENICRGSAFAQLELTLVLREHNEDGETYFVAQCLEIPGCVSQGDTEEEAKKNIDEALELCLSVMLEDCIKLAKSRTVLPDLRGITSQRRVNVTATPRLQFA